jgi:dolichol-phosphate mannosyltransferase
MNELALLKTVSPRHIDQVPVAESASELVEHKSQLSPTSPGPELTVVVPTLNERDNIEPLIDRLNAALAGITWEVIFVDDDSRDGTADHVRSIAQADSRVRCLQRIGRRGLATACIEGILASAAPYLAVIDADLQHDEAILLPMLETLRRESYDIAVGSRYVAGGSVGDWDRRRVRISGFATWLSRMIYKSEVTDPMSGFFMLRRPVFEAAGRRLSGQGFKILLDLLASSPRSLRIKELPYQFRERRFGESKLDALVGWEFVMLVVDKLIGHIVPVRFALFALIGCAGLLIHLAVLWCSFDVAEMPFVWSQTAATLIAMTSNFFLNNLFTYRDMRLKSWRILSGLISFYAVCGFGALANVGIASYVFSTDRAWWLAGTAGVAVGAVWNFAASSVFTWKR